MDGSGTRDWVFTVKCRTRPGEVVCVTGSCESLGRWRSGGVARMTRVDDAADDDAASDEEPMVLKDEAMDLSKKGGGYVVYFTSTFSTYLLFSDWSDITANMAPGLSLSRSLLGRKSTSATASLSSSTLTCR